jgi:hypothetical protein
MTKLVLGAALGALALGLALAVLLGAFGGAEGGQAVKFPRTATFEPALTWVPEFPEGLPLAVPIRGVDPGFNGWTGIVFGKVRPVCNSDKEQPLEVALMRGNKFVTGAVIGKGGGFYLHFEWPLVPRNGGGTKSYELLTNKGAREQITLAVDDRTDVVIQDICPS